MHSSKRVDYTGVRKKVSKLFFAVLTKKLIVREALLRFPKNCEDPTIVASWHALCHLESDEELRLRDSLYRQEQDEYIEFIAHTLEKGDSLPRNIINSYFPYYSSALTPENNNLKGIIQQLKKFLCC